MSCVVWSSTSGASGTTASLLCPFSEGTPSAAAPFCTHPLLAACMSGSRVAASTSLWWRSSLRDLLRGGCPPSSSPDDSPVEARLIFECRFTFANTFVPLGCTLDADGLIIDGHRRGCVGRGSHSSPAVKTPHWSNHAIGGTTWKTRQVSSPIVSQASPARAHSENSPNYESNQLCKREQEQRSAVMDAQTAGLLKDWRVRMRWSIKKVESELDQTWWCCFHELLFTRHLINDLLSAKIKRTMSLFQAWERGPEPDKSISWDYVTNVKRNLSPPGLPTLTRMHRFPKSPNVNTLKRNL